MADFGKRLKELRLGKKMTQQSLADAIGVSRSTIEMYEHGKREPDFETQEAIADYFNVNMDYLFSRIDVSDLYEIVKSLDDIQLKRVIEYAKKISPSDHPGDT